MMARVGICRRTSTCSVENRMDLIPSAEPSVNGSAPEIHARLIDKTGEPPFGIGNLLSQKEQEELRPIARLVDYPRAGTTIFSAGGDADFVYVVDAGIVRIS